MVGDKPVTTEIDREKSAAGEDSQQQNTRRRWRARALVMVPGILVGFLLLIGAFVTHGLLWSIYVPIYDHYLHDVPAPSGLLRGTEWKQVLPESPCGIESYGVDKSQTQLASYYAEELPQIGWQIVGRDSWSVKRANDSQEFSKYERLIFANSRKYWLEITVNLHTDAQGAQVAPSKVSLIVCRDEEWKNVGH